MLILVRNNAHGIAAKRQTWPSGSLPPPSEATSINDSPWAQHQKQEFCSH